MLLLDLLVLFREDGGKPKSGGVVLAVVVESRKDGSVRHSFSRWQEEYFLGSGRKDISTSSLMNRLGPPIILKA